MPQTTELSEAEGWNQTGKDWKMLVASPGNVCLAYTSDDKIIATATAMNYDNELAWIGMVLVHRDHRGKGISKLLIAALLDKLKSCRSVKLDATPAGQPVYEKFGFKSECLVHRMTSDAITRDLMKLEINSSIKQVAAGDISEIITCDQQANGVKRKALIEYLIGEYPQEAFVIRKLGKIKGFALGRTGARYHQIGPLIADSTEDAKKLLLYSLYHHKGLPVVLDVPEWNNKLIGWLLTAGFIKQRHFVRMHLHERTLPGVPQNMYLISGPEFG